jgi:hypothetical protein
MKGLSSGFHASLFYHFIFQRLRWIFLPIAYNFAQFSDKCLIVVSRFFLSYRNLNESSETDNTTQP